MGWGDRKFLPFGGDGGGDVEAGMLYPGADGLDNMLRWGFVRKVYGIISMQLILTTLVAAVVVANAGVQHYMMAHWGVQIGLLVASILLLIPLFIYRQSHPVNLVLLGLWTCTFAVTVGLAVSFYKPAIILQALLITSAVVVGLTLYAFHATRNGVDFTFMAPMLWGCLLAMIVWGFIQMFFPPGPVGNTIFALLGALLFSAYLLLDTQLLIQRIDLDDYIWASVNIYLDVINLFLYLLRLLGESQRNN